MDFGVIIIGDIMLDIWETCQFTDRSENGADILMVISRSENPGGAGNVMMNIYGLGYQSLLCGVLPYYKAVDINDKCYTSGIFYDDTRVLTTKRRIIFNNRQIIRIDHEQVDEISQPAQDHIIEVVNNFALTKRYPVIIVSDYHKGVVTKQILKAVDALLAQQLVRYCVINCKSNVIGYLSHAEASGYTMIVSSSDIGSIDYNDILRSNRLDNLLITKSDKGITLLTSDGVHEIAPLTVEERCAVGAGDTVTAVFAVYLAKTSDPVLAAKVANRAGAIIASQPSMTFITKDIFDGIAI